MINCPHPKNRKLGTKGKVKGGKGMGKKGVKRELSQAWGKGKNMDIHTDIHPRTNCFPGVPDSVLEEGGSSYTGEHHQRLAGSGHHLQPRSIYRQNGYLPIR